MSKMLTDERVVALKDAIESLNKVRRLNASNLKRSGKEWEGYDAAVLDCIAALSSVETPAILIAYRPEKQDG